MQLGAGSKAVIIKGDSQTVIHALARETPAPISNRQIIAGSKTWLTTFTSWATSFTRRDSNVVAHLTAKHAQDIIDCMIGGHSPYYCITYSFWRNFYGYYPRQMKFASFSIKKKDWPCNSLWTFNGLTWE